MRNIAIIPARSGSRGIKDKNIKLLNGKPLLAYSIEAAYESEMFDTIVVSTDSEKYAEIARLWGAETPFLRSTELASDTASSWDVIREVLARYQEYGKTFDSITLLQPTSPLRTAKDICNGYMLMKEKNADCIVAVCETDYPPLWCNTLPPDGSLNGFISQEMLAMPRQKLNTYYRINGALYIVKTKYFLSGRDIYGKGSFAYVMSRETSVDIDNDVDFAIASTLLSRIR